MSELPVNFLPGQNYDCVQCARGCKNDWLISVDETTRASLQGSELVAEVTARYGEPFFYKEERKNYYMNRKPNGECVFLEGAEGDTGGCKSCSIHSKIGYQAKPATCKNFPFIVVETPEDIRVGASFYCTAIQQNVGREFAVHQEIMADFPEGRRLQVGRRPIVLFEDYVTDWEGYKALADFLAGAEVDGQTYETRMVRALLALTRSILATGEGKFVEPAKLRSELARSHANLLRSDWFQLQMSTCLHGITVFLECNEPEEVQAVLKSLYSGASVKLPGCLWEGMPSELEEWRNQALPADLQQELVRYLKAVLFRHYLATHGPVLQSLITLFLNSSLIRQYSRILASVAAEPLGRAHFCGALDRCEHDLMYHGVGFDRIWLSFAKALVAQIDLS